MAFGKLAEVHYCVVHVRRAPKLSSLTDEVSKTRSAADFKRAASTSTGCESHAAGERLRYYPRDMKTAADLVLPESCAVWALAG